MTILGEITRRAVLALNLRVKCRGFYSYSERMVPEHTTAFFSVVDPLHISDTERLFGTAPQAFMSTSFVWVNIIANRCSV